MTSITPNPEMGLLPCPFCGEEDISLVSGMADVVDHRDAHIWCKCGTGFRERDKATATIRWNTRATPALSCPDGFRLVPVEPTAEMVRCGEDALRKSGSGLSQLDGRKAADRIYRAMLAASPAPAVDNAGWRPIASFPKDGELYLVCDDRSLDGDHHVVFWDEYLETPFKLHALDGPAFHESVFTHWQPLPSAPSQDAPQPISQDQDRG